MEKHVENYFKAFGYDKSSFIACEICGLTATQIHHIEPRSSFGSKRKDEQDAVENLAALCFTCHTMAHGSSAKEIKAELKQTVLTRQQTSKPGLKH